MKVQLVLSFNLPSDTSVKLSTLINGIKCLVDSVTNPHVFSNIDVSLLPDK